MGLSLAVDNPADGASITVELRSESLANSPGTVLDTIGTIADSSISCSGVANYFLNLATPFNLSPNTRYWIQLSEPYQGSALWAASSPLNLTPQTGLGEYDFSHFFFDSVQPTSVFGPFQMELSDTPITASPVPEPASLLLFGAGLLGLGGLYQGTALAVPKYSGKNRGFSR